MVGKIRTDVTEGIAAGLGNCPVCDASHECVQYVDGDTIFMPHVEANTLYYLRDNVAFDPVLLAAVCNSCNQTFNTVHVDLISNSDLSEAWVNKYFHRNEIREEPEIPYTVTLSQNDLSDLPSCWQLWRMETAAGFVDQHFLPIAGHYAGGENGLASCSEESIWEDAANLVEAAWPALAKLSGSALPCGFDFEPFLPVERDDFFESEENDPDSFFGSKDDKGKLSANKITERLQDAQAKAHNSGWLRHSSYVARFPWDNTRKKRGLNWRKDQAMTKRRGKSHMPRSLDVYDDFDDDIPF